MKIEMLIPIAGTFHGRPEGVQRGDIVDVSDEIGARYCRLHYAQPVVDRKEERAVAPKGEVRAEVTVPEVADPEVAEPVNPRPGPKPRQA